MFSILFFPVFRQIQTRKSARRWDLVLCLG
ncbi:hypothetical protein PHET_10559 [Paragonimus heterotremus]|uniref:Uncharacterized protein n=1 Tax=Paragonimus heterotremus TaxID=100268 RepID=A0A8J4WN06_9TREM|nr:hypothetical protein PHET_10559 [Paragonimus heterotremus]